MRVGLFGGSFDPPHAGHRAVSLEAIERLRLDAVWWLVSPQNPLKPHAPADLTRRIEAARALADHPRIKVTGIEAALGTTYTADTIRRLKARLPGVRLVWMMGADNLASFHRWRDWKRIASDVPIAVFNRPGSSSPPRMSRCPRRNCGNETSPASRLETVTRSPLSLTVGRPSAEMGREQDAVHRTSK
jgi:nicotinate-nucleotide adenylyltransferase